MTRYAGAMQTFGEIHQIHHKNYARNFRRFSDTRMRRTQPAKLDRFDKLKLFFSAVVVAHPGAYFVSQKKIAEEIASSQIKNFQRIILWRSLTWVQHRDCVPMSCFFSLNFAIIPPFATDKKSFTTQFGIEIDKPNRTDNWRSVWNAMLMAWTIDVHWNYTLRWRTKANRQTNAHTNIAGHFW